MSDFVSASAIKTFLAECPICIEHFNEDSRMPRRMPCCVQSICQQCLETYIRGRQTLSCPLCRHQHHLPGGVKSLPTEPLILKILDHLKIQKGLHLPCIDCPDKNHAIARCDDCCVFLCQECLNAHRRVRSVKDHNVVTFEEMKGRPVESLRRLHQCVEHSQPLQFYCFTCSTVTCVSCTVVDHKEGNGHTVMKIDNAHQKKAASTNELLRKIETKIKKVNDTLEDQKKKLNKIKVSKKAATAEVDQTFDDLMEMLHQRRAVLLSEVETRYDADVKMTEKAMDSTQTSLTKMKSSIQYLNEIRSKADKIEDLQLMVSSADSLAAMLKEPSYDVEISRIGISFVPANIKELKSVIQASGLVRIVQWTPEDIPTSISHLAPKFYDAITVDPANIPEVSGFDTSIADTRIYLPHLEWDESTANQNCSIAGSVVSNIPPDPPLQDTGCRFQTARRVATTFPLFITRGQRYMFQIKTKFLTKRQSLEDLILFEISLNDSMIDSSHSQLHGLSVMVVSCVTHKHKLCLLVYYDNNERTNVPIADNKAGSSGEVHLGVLVDSAGKIHILDVGVGKVIHTITGVVFDKPLWIMMHADHSDETELQGELLSGRRVTMSTKLTGLLKSLRR